MSSRSSKELLSLKAVAKSLKVSERTVYNWLRSGALCGIRLPGKYLIRQQDLAAFLDSRRPHNPAQEVQR